MVPFSVVPFLGFIYCMVMDDWTDKNEQNKDGNSHTKRNHIKMNHIKRELFIFHSCLHGSFLWCSYGMIDGNTKMNKNTNGILKMATQKGTI